ncbi:MAG: hypothetical protein HY787_16015 [Deltaproteobacteria bacterium]|nr:hypothetical protein [Deltaproteobacteria bacterium]
MGRSQEWGARSVPPAWKWPWHGLIKTMPDSFLPVAGDEPRHPAPSQRMRTRSIPLLHCPLMGGIFRVVNGESPQSAETQVFNEVFVAVVHLSAPKELLINKMYNLIVTYGLIL